MSLTVDVRHRIGSLTLEAAFTGSGGITAIFGASGCGKTSLVNIIAGERVVEELVQTDASPDKVAGQLRHLMESPARAAKLQERLADVAVMLGEPGVEKRAAARVAEWLNA